MTDNPYINKQNWGRDLLDRLNNFSDDDGSFNVWEELPTVGKDGLPLDESHKGYTGILNNGSTTTIQSWDGQKWISVLKIPFSSIGDSNITKSIVSNTFDEAIVIYPTNQTNIVLLVSISLGTMTFSAYQSSNGNLLWSSSRALPSGLTYFQNWTAKCIATPTSLYIGIDAKTSASDLLTNTRSILYGYSLTGSFLWESTIDTAQYTGFASLCIAPSGEVIATLGSYLNSKRYVVVNASNGTTIRSAYLIGGGDASFGNDICLNDFIVTFFENDIHSINYINLTLANRLNVGSRPSEGVQRDGNICLFKLNNSLFQYNASTNVSTIIQPLLTGERLICYNPSNLSIQSILGQEIITRTFENNTYPEVAGSKTFSFGVGNQLASTSVSRGTFMSNIKTERYSIGYSSGSKIQYLISFGGQQQKIDLQNSIVTQSSISANLGLFNILSLYAEKAMLPKASISELSVDTVTNLSTRRRPENGIRIGDYCHVFGSFASTNGGSPNYTGSNASSYSVGVLVNAEYVNKDFVSVKGTTDSGAPGYFVALVDPSAGKFFLQMAPPIARDLKISNFPNGSGIVVNTSNNVGIGTESPQFKLDVVGDVRGTNIRNSGGVITSDPRLKTNMTSLNGGELWEICQLLNPITFVYKPDFEVEIQEITKDEEGKDVVNTSKSRWPLPQGIQYGYNALEVEELLPELVDDDPQGIKYLNAGALFPIFQAAATSKIQSLESEVESLKQLVQSLVTRIEVLENA